MHITLHSQSPMKPTDPKEFRDLQNRTLRRDRNTYARFYRSVDIDGYPLVFRQCITYKALTESRVSAKICRNTH